ncbi:MAG: hypothetical protein JJ858_17410 [Rhizobiaceae bacterium]|nr:hypothetical protein [Rhizobiaceae bacterium]
MKQTRTIVTNSKTYSLPIENKGIPIEEHMPNAVLPEDLKGARVYETEDGLVIARQIFK